MELDKEIEAKLKAINEATNKAIADFQLDNDRRLKGLVSEATFKDLEQTHAKRWDAIDIAIAELKKPQVKAVDNKDKTPEQKALDNYLRKGYVGPEEKPLLRSPEGKVLTVADSTHAGVLATPEYAQQIIHYAYVQHPIREVATVRQTSQYELILPTNDAYGVATWVAESSQKSETTGLTFAGTTIIPQEQKVLYKVTQKLLEDADYPVEAEIAYAIGRAFGDLESTAFYSGNGTTTGPTGISVNSTIVSNCQLFATDNTLAFDDFMSAFYKLSAPYAKNASWLMNRTTFGAVLKLKATTTNAYLITPSLTAGQPAALLGAPVYAWVDVPAYVASTDGQYIAFVGDFKQCYAVVDRIDITIQRLVEMYADYGFVGFLARKRVGGGVINPNAAILLKNITT